MSAFKTDREIRLECAKMAAGLCMQLKMPRESIVGVARQIYQFVTEEKPTAESDDDTEFRRGEVRRIG